MTATMKGLLKGLRYISQIFENSDEDEPEMQIGNPTDVKHVAHIGWDGPSVNSPSWMNDFKTPNESESAPLSVPPKNDTLITRRNSEDVLGNKPLEIPPRRFPSLDDPSPEAPEDRKHSRRRHSAGGSINSPGRDIANGHKPRKHQHHSSLGIGVDTASNGAPSPPSIPKKTRKKKPKDKESSVGGMTDGSTKPGGGATDGSLKSGGLSVNGSTKSRTRGHRNSESKSKDNDGTTSALKGLRQDEGKDTGEGIPRHDLDL
ncbi:hypothetical protein ACHQM5_027574 [Ranunculus cassubicifolius]